MNLQNSQENKIENTRTSSMSKSGTMSVFQHSKNHFSSESIFQNSKPKSMSIMNVSNAPLRRRFANTLRVLAHP